MNWTNLCARRATKVQCRHRLWQGNSRWFQAYMYVCVRLWVNRMPNAKSLHPWRAFHLSYPLHKRSLLFLVFPFLILILILILVTILVVMMMTTTMMMMMLDIVSRRSSLAFCLLVTLAGMPGSTVVAQTSNSNSSSNSNTTGSVSPPAGYVNDVYHCNNPQRDFAASSPNSITCNSTTWLWNVKELNPSTPPSVCAGSMQSLQPGQFSLSNVQVKDWFKPCVLWAMMYGNLQPTAAPTASATATSTGT